MIKFKYPLLAIDPGLKNFGLAWASQAIAVEVLAPIKVSRWQLAIDHIEKVLTKLNIKTLIIGQPETKPISQISQKIANHFKDQKLKVILLPETLSSQTAWQKMSRNNFSFKQKKTLNHSYAALEILASFISTQA